MQVLFDARIQKGPDMNSRAWFRIGLATIDLSTPPAPRWPGRVIQAGLFGEQWRQ
jgi:hypothetical protein